jgi:hypothetical protein
MKSKLLVSLLAVVTINASAQHYWDWDDPAKPFDASQGREDSNITWKRVSNVKEACEKESKRRGFGGFNGAEMQACSFYYGNECTLITSKNPTMWTLGHEVRHCFQGQWHK